ncbi:MAG: hypothetical protein ABS942_15925 [Solibacillus sp.]|uniref:hypothetical protein n=1 Tax=Solibacillus sp. FSL H8-0523 TaxID=2954511 RepID=UPI0031018535
MKKRKTTLIGSIVILLAVTFLFINNSSKTVESAEVFSSSPKVQEQVENVKSVVSVEQEHKNRKIAEYTNLLVSEEMELGKIIANETGFEEESVEVNFMPISGGDYPDILCLIILSTENKIDKTTEQLIVKNTMTFVSDIKNKLREEQIFIVNQSGKNLTLN